MTLPMQNTKEIQFKKRLIQNYDLNNNWKEFDNTVLLQDTISAETHDTSAWLTFNSQHRKVKQLYHGKNRKVKQLYHGKKKEIIVYSVYLNCKEQLEK